MCAEAAAAKRLAEFEAIFEAALPQPHFKMVDYKLGVRREKALNDKITEKLSHVKSLRIDGCNLT